MENILAFVETLRRFNEFSLATVLLSHVTCGNVVIAGNWRIKRNYLTTMLQSWTKFEPLKPSHSGDISLLVFKISKKAVKQPCLDQKLQCLFSKYSYFLYIF